jgi:hypothetical protein
MGGTVQLVYYMFLCVRFCNSLQNRTLFLYICFFCHFQWVERCSWCSHVEKQLAKELHDKEEKRKSVTTLQKFGECTPEVLDINLLPASKEAAFQWVERCRWCSDSVKVTHVTSLVTASSVRDASSLSKVVTITSHALESMVDSAAGVASVVEVFATPEAEMERLLRENGMANGRLCSLLLHSISIDGISPVASGPWLG